MDNKQQINDGANSQTFNAFSDNINEGNGLSTPSTNMTAFYSTETNKVSNVVRSEKKHNRIIIIVFIVIAVIGGTIATLFLTRIIGRHGVEVGDFSYTVNEDDWNATIGKDGNTLVLMNAQNSLSAIGILPYNNEITYEMLSQKDAIKKIFNNITEYKLESQSEEIVNDTKCIVANIKYNNATYANDKAIKAFCENKDNTVFLIEVEGVNQSTLNTNLSVGVDIINSAKHK